MADWILVAAQLYGNNPWGKYQRKPIRSEDNGTGQSDEDDEQNKPTTTAGARAAFTKTKSVLQPVE